MKLIPRDDGRASRTVRTCFFVTGAGRSGSTYLYYLLKAHPRVAITNEARVLDALGLALEAVTLPYGHKSPTSGLVGQIRPEAIPAFRSVFLDHSRRMVEEFYERSFKHDFTHYGDKLADPLAVGHAANLHPDIRVVMLVRDPRDVVCSYRSLQAASQDLGPRQDEMNSMTVRGFAQVWRDTYDFLLALVPRFLLVPYVDLVGSPEPTVRRILEHLGLDFVEGVEKAIRGNDTIGGHGTSATPAGSIGRWRRDLTEAEAREVVEICAPLMSRLGLGS
jgi:hypothetical protein